MRIEVNQLPPISSSPKRTLKHISAPAADLYYEEGTSKERLSLSIRHLLGIISGEKDPLLNELHRLSEENRKLKDALQKIRDSLDEIKRLEGGS